MIILNRKRVWKSTSFLNNVNIYILTRQITCVLAIDKQTTVFLTKTYIAAKRNENKCIYKRVSLCSKSLQYVLRSATHYTGA